MMQQADGGECGKCADDDGQTDKPKVVLVHNAIKHRQHVCLAADTWIRERCSVRSARK